MTTARGVVPGDWQVGVKVWLERAGQAIMGEGRLALLVGIEHCRSISAAARRIGMSYRHAWLQVQAINQAAGEPLVIASPGGRDGGGARLTTVGRWAVAAFKDAQQELHQAAAQFPLRQASTAEDRVVHVAAAVTLDQVLGQLLTDFSLQRPEVPVRAFFGASDELASLVQAGSPADLFLSASPAPLDQLQAIGLVEKSSRAILAENTLAAIARADRVLPVRRPRDMTRPEAGRIALAEPRSPLGTYSRDYLQRLRLYDDVMSRAVLVESSRAVVAAVRVGHADMGLVYGSDTCQVPDCRVLFRVRQGPTPIQVAGGVIRSGHQGGPARSLLGFLTSPLAARRFRSCGFVAPANRRRPNPRSAANAAAP